MDKASIEKFAVNAVEDIVNSSDHLSSFIADNDKEPSWDGNVEVYRRAADKHAKKDLFLRVPVQVKGHKENNLKKQSVYFSGSITE